MNFVLAAAEEVHADPVDTLIEGRRCDEHDQNTGLHCVGEERGTAGSSMTSRGSRGRAFRLISISSP